MVIGFALFDSVVLAGVVVVVERVFVTTGKLVVVDVDRVIVNNVVVGVVFIDGSIVASVVVELGNSTESFSGRVLAMPIVVVDVVVVVETDVVVVETDVDVVDSVVDTASVDAAAVSEITEVVVEAGDVFEADVITVVVVSVICTSDISMVVDSNTFTVVFKSTDPSGIEIAESAGSTGALVDGFKEISISASVILSSNGG